MKEYTNPVLICDDDINSTLLLSQLLKEKDYSVITAKDGVEALIQLKREAIDVVVLDIEVPGVCNIELLKMLKFQERKLGRRLHIIVVTAMADPQTTEKAMEAGASFFFTKPADYQKVLERVELEINEARLDRGYMGSVTGITCSSEELFNQIMKQSLERAPKLDAKRFHFTPASVSEKAPELKGVLTLRNQAGVALLVEWSENIRKRLNYYLALSPEQSEVRKDASIFEYALSEDKKLTGTVFDKVYNELGSYPLLMASAPEGSKYFKTREENIRPEQHEILTEVTGGTAEDLAKVEALVAASPEDSDLKDWLAFRYFSHGKFQEAIALYREMIAAGSKKPAHHFYLGNALYKNNEHKEAIKHWEIVANQKRNIKLSKKAVLRLRGAKRKHGI